MSAGSVNVRNSRTSSGEPGEQPEMKERMLAASPPEQGTSKQTDETNPSRSCTTGTVAIVTRKRNRRVWTLVTGDGENYRCNECKKVIKCCSPTNITRHYTNNHPETLNESYGMMEAQSKPIIEENSDDTSMNASDVAASSGSGTSTNRANSGKVDWTSPAIRKVLEMVASRELTERMGTQMIAYKSGCQLSASTVRKRVHSLLEAKYGAYPKKNDGAESQATDGDNQTVTYLAMSSDGGDTKYIQVEGKKIQGQEPPEEFETDSPSVTPIPRQVRSLRLSRSSIVIPEKEDPSMVRIYRCSAYGRGKQGATCYYRCSKCDSLANNKLKNSGAAPSERTKRYFAHIKTKDGQIIGNAYPEHLPECKPVPKEVQQLQEIDRACRARIQAGNLTPEAARKLGALVAQKNRELKRHIQDDDTFPDRWKSLPKKYSRLCHQAERMRKQKNKQLLRMMNNEQVDDGIEEDQSGTAHEAEIMSGRFKYPPLIIFEPDGLAARIYRINGKSDRLGIAYYRCSKCDVLCRRHRKMGNIEGMTRATVKVEEDEILENMYPPHHEECEVMTLDMVKNLAENLDRFFFAKDYESIIHDSAKTDLRFTDGTLISKHQISAIVNHPAEQVAEEDINVDITHVASTEEVDNETWETMMSQDLLNVGEEEHEGPVGESCHRYYEANIALRRDMMRCLEEMRALRNEMRSMLEEGKLQYVEVDDEHYEEIVVDENE